MKEDVADQTIRRFVAAWEHNNAAELVNYFSEDAVWNREPFPTAMGKPAVRQAIVQWLGFTTQLGAQIHRQISDGTTVMHERTDRYRLATEEMLTKVAAVFEVHDGLITAWREYFDMTPFVAS